MAFPSKGNMIPLKGLGGPPASPVMPSVPKSPFGMKKVGKRKPTNKANKFARALTKAPRAIDKSIENY